MSLCDRYNYLAQDINMITFSDLETEKKKEYLEDFKIKLEKLDEKYSKEERFLGRFNIFETHLSAVFTCQDVCHIILDQLQKRIEKEEEGLV